MGLGSLDMEFTLFAAKRMIKLPSLLLSVLNWHLNYVIINTGKLFKFQARINHLVRTLLKSNVCEQNYCNLQLTLMELFNNATIFKVTSSWSKKSVGRGWARGVKNHEIYVTAFGGHLSLSWRNFTLLDVGGAGSTPPCPQTRYWSTSKWFA